MSCFLPALYVFQSGKQLQPNNTGHNSDNANDLRW